ncbi:MAG: 4Fe-4S binding protein [Rhodospirillaceae bacterium]|jgi:pyruvate ferredoxin oxidoreductase gamma subunit|nr:4Fe-4S binding protein [Rhodospirillaceae bacterium]MBT4588107.1 4Fe-4S binding protein [Rhodospirillaceae bacterium]MBT5941373.1 4Fe-4S binding protein [Rhodospirillaceae bacterium]MBT7268429.1 4Fe-4S binding protein [Rhodospirillaceae bacterium]
MYRIRFHGRGGQGMKTAGRILGSAFFLEGFEVQDSPRYGAERRGAPLTSAVRAGRSPIYERGIILKPDLIVVADDTLVPVPAAGVLQGVEDRTAIIIDSDINEPEWHQRLQINSVIHTLPAPKDLDRAEMPYVGSLCAGAAARLTGVISRATLEQAVLEELHEFKESVIEENIERALNGFDLLADYEGTVIENTDPTALNYQPPQWIDLPNESVNLAGPAVHGGATSVEVRTGLWRTMRPIIELDHCNKCTWVCGSFCPDSAISVDPDGFPEIDYDHCKGCLICAAQCPPHAISVIPERDSIEKEEA